MSTIKESLHFNYNGQSSKDFEIISVNTSGGMFEEMFVASRDIIETRIAKNDTPYFQGLDTAPREFELQLAFVNGFTDELIDRVNTWLFQDIYKPLYFEDKPERLYYCLAVGDSSITHNGLNEGYITITMRCDSPFVYSPFFTTESYDLSTNSIKFAITIENKGHFMLYPEISIEKIGLGKITFTNTSNGGSIFEILNLTDKEKIYINCEKEMIETDIIGEYRYEDIIGDFLEFSYGKNTIEVEGTCIIQIRYQYKFKY